jgi:hypothetical protein
MRRGVGTDDMRCHDGYSLDQCTNLLPLAEHTQMKLIIAQWKRLCNRFIVVLSTMERSGSSLPATRSNEAVRLNWQANYASRSSGQQILSVV